MKYRYHLDPPFNNPSKKSIAITIEADSIDNADKQVTHSYPNWRVSMFWPICDSTQKPYDPEPSLLALQRQPYPLEHDPRLVALHPV